jgi:hypothetical protein
MWTHLQRQFQLLLTKVGQHHERFRLTSEPLLLY